MGSPVSRLNPLGDSVGTPTYIPHNDRHDALIILNIRPDLQIGRWLMGALAPPSPSPAPPV